MKMERGSRWCAPVLAYTEVVMRRSVLLLILAISIAIPSFGAKGPEYAKAVLISLKHTKRARTVAWQSNTPLQTDDDVFDLKVQVGTDVYSGQYIPHDEGASFPEDVWNEGDKLQARVIKRDLYLKRPSGPDLRVFISKHMTATPLAEDPAPQTPTPQPATKK